MLRKFLNDDRGATVIEYGLIIAVVSLAMVGGLGLAMDAIRDNFVHVSETVESAGP